MMLLVSSHNSGVDYNNSTVSYHSLIVHECIANSVPLDYLIVLIFPTSLFKNNCIAKN